MKSSKIVWIARIALWLLIGAVAALLNFDLSQWIALGFLVGVAFGLAEYFNGKARND